jgi:peptide/nickel transport system substrate-binding protein
VGFDAFLWGTGRIAMSSPAQLNNPDTCPRQPIGTGPFMCQGECWVVNDRFTAVRNPNYWREDENGEQLPYLDEIEFRPVIEVGQRVNGLKGGDLQLIHTTDGQQIETLRSDAEAGTINLLESDFAAETSYVMLNVRPESPFSNRNARLAAAHAANSDEIIDITQAGLNEPSVQPFAKDNLAYADPEELDYPKHDPDKARQFIERYKQETGESELAFTLVSTTDPGTIEQAELIQSQAEAVGMRVTIDQVEQAQIINTALSGDFEALVWRNHPGGDPGTQYVWWYSTVESGADNFVNFSRIKDPEIDRLFTEGRAETDPARRAEIYQGISKRFAEEAYNLWGWYTLWAFAAAPDVHGLFPPELPDGSEPVIIASVQPVVGLWRG